MLLLHQVYIKDTDERACAYIAGPAPNRWGFATEGNDLFNVIQRSDADGNSSLICARLVICHVVDSKYLTVLFEELPTYVSNLHKCFFVCWLIFFVLLQQKYPNQ